MVMRASEQERVAETGISEAKSKFQRLGWGPVENREHDLGTDLLVQARDNRRFSRGLIVGVQVKAGASYFERVLTENGQVVGWWYYESDKDHFDDWVTHCLPHLLVLHNLDTSTSYWVHVTADTVVSTGQGCKILIRKTQTIDAEHAEALYAVACQQKAAPTVEGTAFFGPRGGVPPARQLRYALLAPRLVAPHPNAGHQSAVNAVEALALVAQGRFRDMGTFADKHPSVPHPERCCGTDWTWRFVAAVWNWATTDRIEQLETLFRSASTQEAIAASGVLLACALRRLNRHSTALAVLDDLVNSDNLWPVDHGWALVQRARVKTEIGDTAGARQDAVEAQRSFQGDDDDITVSALAAAAAWHLFIATDQAVRDHSETLEDFTALITESDTAISWWRSQTVSWGFYRAEGRQFKSWAGHSLGPRYGGLQHLFAAELNADLTGEHSSWRSIAAVAARQQLLWASSSDNEVAELVKGLDALRRSGDYQSMKSAYSGLIQDGPLEAVTESVSSIPPLSKCTRTTADSTLETLAVAGDFLDEPTATEFLLSSAPLVSDPSEFTERLQPSYIVPFIALKAVNGLLPAAGDPAHDRIVDLLLSLPSPPLSYLEPDLLRTVSRLDLNRIGPAKRNALWVMAQQHEGHLRTALLGKLAANAHPDAKTELSRHAVDGDLYALAVMDDVTALSTGNAATLMAHLEDTVIRTLSNARRGHHVTDALDPVSWLTRLNLWFPDESRWNGIIELLLDPVVKWRAKRPTCLVIAHMAEKFPTGIRATLSANVPSIVTVPPEIGIKAPMGGLDVVLGISVGTLTGIEADTEATKLAFRSAQQREYLAMLLGLGRCPNLHPILATLISDPDPDVRFAAAWAVGKLATKNVTKPIEALVRELASKDGTPAPNGLLKGLGSNDGSIPAIGVESAQNLLQHPAAQTRRSARLLLRRADAPTVP